MPVWLWRSLTIIWRLWSPIYFICTADITLLRHALNLLQDNILSILQLLNLYLKLAYILKNLVDIHFSKSYILKDFIYLLIANLTVFFFIHQITFYFFNFIAYLQFNYSIHILYFKFNLLYFCNFLSLCLLLLLHLIIQIFQLFSKIKLQFI